MSSPFDSVHYIEKPARSALNKVGHNYFGFRYTLNLYRGCRHGCPFCYARYTHWFLGYERPRDFETQIEVKINAPDLLAGELKSSFYDGTLINLGAATDNYQPAEKKYRLTRSCLALLDRHDAPAVILTKSDLVTRDLDILREMNRRGRVTVIFTLTTLDPAQWQFLEPHTLPPQRRLDAMRAVADAGIPTGLHIMPFVPFLTDTREALEPLIAAAKEAGASFCGTAPLALATGRVKGHYLSALRRFDHEAYRRTLGLFQDQAVTPADYMREKKRMIDDLLALHGLTGGYPDNGRTGGQPGLFDFEEERIQLDMDGWQEEMGAE